MYSAKDIPIGAENAISRAALARKWNCSDRQARRVLKRIEMQQMHGEGIA